MFYIYKCLQTFLFSILGNYIRKFKYSCTCRFFFSKIHVAEGFSILMEQNVLHTVKKKIIHVYSLQKICFSLFKNTKIHLRFAHCLPSPPSPKKIAKHSLFLSINDLFFTKLTLNFRQITCVIWQLCTVFLYLYFLPQK